MSLIIRPARKKDGIIASCLLAETTRDFGVQVLGLGDPDLQIKAFSKWFADEGNRFSYQYTQIAEKYGIAAGLLLAFSGAELPALEMGCARQMFKIYGILGAIRMINRNRTLSDYPEAEKDEYIITHLAVDENFRRQGIGNALITRAVEDATRQGFKKLVLEVEMDNSEAVALYKRQGFEVVNTFYYNDKRGLLTSPGFHKMLKLL